MVSSVVDDAKLIVVVLDWPKLAVPVGTEPVDQFAPLLKFPDPGDDNQVAFCATAGNARLSIAIKIAPRKRTRVIEPLN
jgi:hypothetical protein